MMTRLRGESQTEETTTVCCGYGGCVTKFVSTVHKITESQHGSYYMGVLRSL